MENTARNILENELSIPKDEYEKLFNIKAKYDFPSLKIEDNGIFTGKTDEYDIFDKFKLNNGNYQYELKNPDVEIEKFIIGNKIKQMRIDLYQHLKGPFSNHECYVYPSQFIKTQQYMTHYI
jgi:hypothetical protein